MHENVVVALVLEEEQLPGGKLSKVLLDIGGGADTAIEVVTNAPNAKPGKRVVVAKVGAEVQVNGDEITVKSTSVSGTISNGMLCDSPMLGWTGGAAGVAALVPDTFSPGDAPPATRPRLDGGGARASEQQVALQDENNVLFKKKLTKEEKKAALAKRKADRAKKKAGKEEVSTNADAEEAQDTETPSENAISEEAVAVSTDDATENVPEPEKASTENTTGTVPTEPIDVASKSTDAAAAVSSSSETTLEVSNTEPNRGSAEAELEKLTLNN